MNISVCIITKNECEKLKKCLSRLAPCGFELVVADTGSRDGTLEMVKEYTESLYEFAWIDDFAAAKNYAIQKAANDMVLVVDSDEYLCSGSVEAFRILAAQNTDKVGRLKRIEKYTNNAGEYTESISGTSRVFDRRKFHFEGRIHEQVVPGSVFGEEGPVLDHYDTYETGLVFEHDGYEGSKEERQKKAERNIALLLQALKEAPEDTYLLYQTAKGYYMANRPEKAVEYFERAISGRVDPRLEWVIDMVETYGYALLDTKQYQRAIQLEGVYEEFCGSADFVFLMGLIYMNNGEFDQGVSQFLKATKMKNAKTRGVNSYKAFYNIGVILECTGRVEEAITYYRKAGDYDRAKKRIAALL